MVIRPGGRLGSYDVIELIGEGGMGSVYRAQDTTLGREVAIKVVRESVLGGPEAVLRLHREARMLASINHPHIATIHGFEESEGTRYLVLELVPGVTLDQRLAEGPMPVREALHTASQIAEAVEAAHERGVIHRDLKPSNIKLTPQSGVKVLDFGLAKAFIGDSTAQPLSQSPTISSGGTRDGAFVGTVAYMSPEQTRGQPIDRRMDVWAFGCVFYEMLTARPVFASSTLSDTIAAVLTREPNWSALPPDVPPSIHRLLRRCLEKDSTRRLRDIGDARLEIDQALTPPPDLEAFSTETLVDRRGIGSKAPGLHLLWIIPFVVVAGVLGWILKPAPRERPVSVVQFAIPMLAVERLGPLDFPVVALSPLATHIAYAASRGGDSQIFVRPLSALEATPIPGTSGALGPFFSPDGQWIGFFAGGKLKKVHMTGGAVTTIADAPIGFGGSWGPDNTIVFAPNNGSALWRVSADGGTPRVVTNLDTNSGEFSHRWPHLLPGGKAVLFTVGTRGSFDDAEIAVQSLDEGTRQTAARGGSHPQYSAGHLLYARAGSIFAAPFDLHAQRVSGDASAAFAQVLTSPDGAAQIATSPAGSVVYVPAGASPADRTLVWMDREGNTQPLAAPARAYSAPRLSPDGRRIAVTIAGDKENVWTYEIARSELTPFTFEGGSSPVWSRDGSRIAFGASRTGTADLFWKRADGGGAEERVTTSARSKTPASWSPDGRLLAFVEHDPAGSRDISIVTVEPGGDRTVQAFLASAANETAPAFSPDGRWIAYVSDESGQNEVYVASASSATRPVRVSSGGGSEPAWHPSGTELFFRSGDRMMAAKVRAPQNLMFEPARELFKGRFERGGGSRPGYDVSTDGRFLMVSRGPEGPPARELRVIIGWSGELTRGVSRK